MNRLQEINNINRTETKQILNSIKNNKEYIKLYQKTRSKFNNNNYKIVTLIYQNIELYKTLRIYKQVTETKHIIKPIVRKEEKEPEFDLYDNTQNDIMIESFGIYDYDQHLIDNN